MTTKIWFVVHRNDLWKINDRIIGFWNKNINFDPINSGDVVIYYRGGNPTNKEKGRIQGIFKVLFKGKDIDMNFSKQKVDGNLLEWQFVLELKHELNIEKPQIDKFKDKLSFYDEWEDHKWGSQDKQIFKVNEADIKNIERIL